MHGKGASSVALQRVEIGHPLQISQVRCGVNQVQQFNRSAAESGAYLGRAAILEKLPQSSVAEANDGQRCARTRQQSVTEMVA